MGMDQEGIKSSGLTREAASDIYDLLIKYCEAPPSYKDHFVNNQTIRLEREWRFMGNLGFGGKFWRHDDMWYVNCYPEDTNDERAVTILQANTALSELKARYPGQY